MKLKRVLALVLAAAMLVSSSMVYTGTTVYAQESGEDSMPITGDTDSVEPKEGTVLDEAEWIVKEVDESEVNVDLIRNPKLDLLNEETVSPDDMVRVIIVMDGESIVEDNAKAKMNFLTKLKTGMMERKQKSVVSKIEKNVLENETLDIRYHYTWLLNGVATEVPYGMISEIEAINGVKEVILQPVYTLSGESAKPRTIADGNMIGRDDTWASGYTGKGMKIAVVDTGLDSDHQNFQAMEEDCLTKDSATKDKIASVLDQLNASALFDGLTVDHVYYSNKVAYGFNYIDETLDITHDNDLMGDHGTHVAGIAAANDLKNGEAVGVAPDAQLYIMKVFGQGGGSYAEDILASLEDALLLEADVVNMSLGSPAGFTSGGPVLDEIYSRVEETDTVLAVAAGNAATSGYGNLWGTDTNLTSNPDNSTVGSPSTYANATSVASVNNAGVKKHYIAVGDKKFGFTEANKGKTEPVSTIAGKEYDYAIVGNYGQTVEDFTAADVAGKIAVVSRGVCSFGDKVYNAEKAGAVACIVYNNVAESIIMDLTGCEAVIPAASVSMAAGEYLVSVKEEAPETKITFSDRQEVIVNDDGYKMSNFSSWGVSPDLHLEPEITAPGGDIYSTLDGGKYGLMSGTSMACPNLAGVAALVMQYVKAEFPQIKDESDIHAFVNSLMTSTAVPLMYDDTVTYSPRLQGSGLANAYNAINTNTCLSVDGMDVPKAEVYDDKDGNYTYKFHLNNFGDKDSYYGIHTTVQTEDVWDVPELGESFMAMTPVVLDAVTEESGEALIYTYDYNENGKVNTSDARYLYLKVPNDEASKADEFFRYNLDKDEDADYDDVQAYLDALVEKDVDVDLEEKVVKVEAGKTADITVNVAVTETGKAFMDANFENGIYVEGYTMLTAKMAGGVDLSLPFLGFYGDWTKAPIFDKGTYYDPKGASQYLNYVITQQKEAYGGIWLPGLNPYIDEAFDTKHISFSPNGDMKSDDVMDMHLSLMRNAATIDFTYTNAESGDKYYSSSATAVRKAYYIFEQKQMMPYVYSWDVSEADRYKMTDADGNILPNNTKLNLTVKATLDYDKHESDNVFDTWVIPMTIDTESPSILTKEDVAEGEAYSTVYTDAATGKQYLELIYKDNLDIAAITILNKGGTRVLGQYDVVDLKPGEYRTEKFDVTGFGNKFLVVLGDYAFNESFYSFETVDNDPILDASKLYGYRVYDQDIMNDTLYGWISLDREDASREVYSSEYYMDYALTAAEFVGGYIIAVDANNDLVSIKPGYWDERTKIASLGDKITELTFDPTTQTLYAYDKSNNPIPGLVKIDYTTGEMTRVTTGYMPLTLVAMACADDGTLYGIDGAGNLKVIDKTTGKFTGTTLLNTKDVTKYAPTNTQSMTYDSEEDCIYWTYFFHDAYKGTYGTLYRIDITDGYKITEVGKLDGNAEVVGLLKLDNKGFELPKDAKLETLTIDPQSTLLIPGAAEKLTAVLTPWYAAVEELVWTSSNPEVVTVNENGIISGVAVGDAVITVEANGMKAECNVTVVQPDADINAFAVVSNTLNNQWMTVEADHLENFKALSEEGLMNFTAGEYVDGVIYAYNAINEFYKIDAKTFEAVKVSDPIEYPVIDMAYDYSTGYMYAVIQHVQMGMTLLAHVDISTGAVEIVGSAMDQHNTPACALAVSTEGEIYIMTYNGMLNKFNLNMGGCEPVGLTGYTGSQMLQSMAYDHNNDVIYWAMLGEGGVSAMMYVDPATGKALPLGTVDGVTELVAMYIVPDEPLKAPYVPVEAVTMPSDTLIVLEGSTKGIPVQVLPFNATDRNVTWTVAEEDKEIASINNGMVTGLKAGTATVTGTLGDFTVTFTVKVVASAGDIYGYILSDIYVGGMLGIWAKFNDKDLSKGEGIIGDESYTLFAAEYYDGKVYGYGVDPNTGVWSYMTFNKDTLELEKKIPGQYADIKDMAFDYSQGSMYAIGGALGSQTHNLYAIDIETGEQYLIGETDLMLAGLACSTDGTLYTVDVAGNLYTFDKTTAQYTLVGPTGFMGSMQYQSMAFDHNTGNLYWAQYMLDNFTGMVDGSLLLVDPKTAKSVSLGKVGLAGSEVTGMYIIPNDGIKAQTPEVNKIVLQSSSAMLKAGETTQITAQAFPISVGLKDVVFHYVSADTNVATVDENGVVTAVGEGSTVITVSSGVASVEYAVNVVGDSTKLYVMNKTGWQVSPLLNPMKIDSKVTFPNNMEIKTAVYNKDGYFYAIDAEGYLWKYTEDLTVMEKIGEKTVAEQFSNYDKFSLESTVVPPTVLDITADVNSDKLYALGVGWLKGQYTRKYSYFIYEVDKTTGAAKQVGSMPSAIQGPVAITVTGDNELTVYDQASKYIYRIKITCSTYDAPSTVAWAQEIVVPAQDTNMGMIYNPVLNRVFIAAIDDHTNNNKMALYMLNPETNVLEKISNAAYDRTMVDLLFVYGTPVSGEPVAEEPISEVEAVSEEVTVESEEETVETEETVMEETVTEE